IILFGSAARGEMTEESDLDILVVVRGPVNRFHLTQEIYGNMRDVGVPLDVVVATTEDLQAHRDNPGMIYGIALEEGREVYAQ
ncbi:nucleotidyltransferase domain-containing protein, partial [mine drainage metagenome]